jgi:hypothetical protein
MLGLSVTGVVPTVVAPGTVTVGAAGVAGAELFAVQIAYKVVLEVNG